MMMKKTIEISSKFDVGDKVYFTWRTRRCKKIHIDSGFITRIIFPDFSLPLTKKIVGRRFYITPTKKSLQKKFGEYFFREDLIVFKTKQEAIKCLESEE